MEKIISIITPSFNQGEFIEETIQSVLSQTGNFYIDYIIMDGGSKDNTIEIVKKYEELLRYKSITKSIKGIDFYVSEEANFEWNRCLGISYRWVSDKDEGQAAAINMGFERAIGEVVGWLNSDDVYCPECFKKILQINFEFCYGKGIWFSKEGKNLLDYPTFEPNFYSFNYQCTLCQPAVFFMKKIIADVGLLDNTYYCAFDFEYWLRALFKGKKFTFIDEYLAKSRIYRENKSLANQDIVKKNVEDFKQKYYSRLRLSKRKLENYIWVHNETAKKVDILNNKLEISEKLNIIFDATVIANGISKDLGRSGIFFVALNILLELLKRKDLNITLCCDKSRIPDLKIVLKDKKVYKCNVIAKENLDVSCFLAKNYTMEDIDVYFSPVFKVPKIIQQLHYIKRYTLVHDLILLLHPEFIFGNPDWFKEMIGQANEDDYYFTVSENTKKDLLNCIPQIEPEKVTVTPLAASKNFYHCNDEVNIKNILKKYDLPTDKKYIFSLCTLEPRKNLIFSIKAFIKFISQNKIEDLVFILGGSQWDAFVRKIEEEIASFEEYKSKIIKAGYIDDEDIAPLFSGAEFSVYPSLYEGFGLPLLESMQCGVPVITSNNSSLPEIAGEAALLIDPASEDELVDAMKILYFDAELRQEMSRKGMLRAKLFSWQKTADIMIPEMKKDRKTFIDFFNQNFYADTYSTPMNILKKRCEIWKRKLEFAVFSPNKFFKKYAAHIFVEKRKQ